MTLLYVFGICKYSIILKLRAQIKLCLLHILYTCHIPFFTPSVNFSDLLNKNWGSRAMTEIWGKKTRYANACHRPVTTKFRQGVSTCEGSCGLLLSRSYLSGQYFAIYSSGYLPFTLLFYICVKPEIFWARARKTRVFGSRKPVFLSAIGTY